MGKIVASDPSHERYKKLIQDTLERFPRDVKEKIEADLKKPIIFLISQNEYGAHDEGIIVLNTGKIDNEELCDNQIQYVIAHELTHFYLGQPPPMKPGMREQQETDVEQLLKKWGFTKNP